MPECPTCGQELDTSAGVSIHHYYKHDESIALEESTCNKCEDVFEYYPSDKEGIYCGDCADNSWGNDNLSIGSGEENPRWRGGPVSDECSFCAESIEVDRWNYEEYNNHFCSKDCESKFRSKQFSGEGNPRYIDGKHRQRNYGTGWRNAKKNALERDGYSCVVCDRGIEELGRNPAVHHKKPVRTFDNPTDAHYLSNLVCLCPKHHQQVEAGNRKI